MKKTCGRILIALLAAALCLPWALAASAGLKKGDQGADVQALQMRLVKLGYSVGKVDGDYGNKTKAAVQAFQKDRGLPVTGSVDEATHGALYDERETAVFEGYTAEVALEAPFTYLDKEEGSGGVLVHLGDDVVFYVDLIRTPTITHLTGYVLDYYENTVFARDAGSSAAAGYESRVLPFDSNGRVAALIEATYDYTYGGQTLTAHLLWGAVELAKDGDGAVALRINTRFNTVKGEQTLLTADSLRGLFARAELTGAPAPAQTSPQNAAGSGGDDPILGSWYALLDNTALRMEFTADGRYVVYESDGTPYAAGEWARIGDGYAVDGESPLVFDGDTFTIGSGDTAFGRQPVEQPALPFARDAEAEDCLGAWTVTGFYMSDKNGLYDEESNMLGEGDAMTVVCDGPTLTLTGMSDDDEVYSCAWEDGALRLSPAPGADLTTFDSAVMRLLEDGTAVMYTPGIAFLTITLEKTH